jgi:membrane protein YqaA with SNARE-associated domain
MSVVAVLGSTIGSLFLYGIAFRGGESGAAKIQPGKARARDANSQSLRFSGGFWSRPSFRLLFLSSSFVLSAGAFRLGTLAFYPQPLWWDAAFDSRSKAWPPYSTVKPQ